MYQSSFFNFIEHCTTHNEGLDEIKACVHNSVCRLKHIEIDIGADKLLQEPLELCVQSMATFDGMQLRNSAVVACALLEAKKQGLKFIYTGMCGVIAIQTLTNLKTFE